MSEYKIQLGVDLDTSDIRKQLNKFTDNTHRIRIDIDNSRLLKQIDHAKKELQSLNKINGNNKPSLDINSVSLEKSLDRVANSIDEIRKSLGTLDSKSGMQSLLSSINQITTALGKAENETDSLVKSLSALAKKDLSLNFDIKLGKSNSIDRNTIFGTKVRNDILPELQKQVKAYEDYFANYYKGKYREGSSPLSGLLTGSSVWEKNKTNIIDVNTRMADSSHLENQIKAYAQYISIIKEAASLKGIDVSSVDSQFSTSADEIVKNAIEIKTGAKEAKESVEQLKSVFGGINVSELSTTLKPIVEDLKSIREAIDNLSKGASIDGLTQSFNRLSEVLDKVDASFGKIQNDINIKSPNIDKRTPVSNKLLLPSDMPEMQPIDMTEASQFFQNIGRSITQSAEQTLNLDDVIDKEVTELMQKYEIVGEKGSDAFNKIKQAVIECRSALQTIKDSDFDMFGEDKDLLIAHANSEAIDKVTKALAEQIRVANNLGDEYVKLANYMTSFNDPTKGNKVRIPDFVKQEQGDDYRSNRGSLGIAFNTKEGISFVDFINDLNTELGQTISLTNGEAAAMDELLHKLEIGRQQRDVLNKSENYLNATASTEEILEQNGINRNEIYTDVISIVDSVNTAEQQMTQSSTQSANTVVQNNQRVQQSYEELKQRIDEINKSIYDYLSLVGNPNTNFDDKLKYLGEIDKLKLEGNNLIDNFNQTKDALESEAQQAQETANIVVQNEERKQRARKQTTEAFNNFKEADIVIGATKDNINNLENALNSLGFDNKSIDILAKDFEQLGISVKNVTTRLREDGSITLTVKGIDQYERAVTTMKSVTWNEDDGKWSINNLGTTVSQSLKESEQFIKQQKTAAANLTNQINQINRAAIDESASRPIKSKEHIEELRKKYTEITKAIERMKNASSDAFVDEQIKVKELISNFKRLVKEYKNAENVSVKMKGTNTETGIKIAKNDLEKFKAQAKDFPQITQTIKDLDKAIKGVGDSASLNKFNDQLRVARSELAKIKAETIAANRKEKVGIDVSEVTSAIVNLQRISPEIDKFETEIDGAKVSIQSLLNDLSKVNTAGDFSVVNKRFHAFEKAAEAAGIAVRETAQKLKSVDDIKFNIDFGKYENQMDDMRHKAIILSDEHDTLKASIEKVENAYKEMLSAAEANSGNVAGDRERLIKAEEEYANALEKTNNLIKIQARAEKLSDKKTALKLDMENYLKNNSRAAKEFGAEIRRLSSDLDGLDSMASVNNVERKFKNLTRTIRNAGKDGLTVFDQFKTKFKQYSAYFSVAEVFMYIEQGLRQMFNTVKEIDTAMTGLYRVTDLTSSQYNILFDNMISSAKEYGATLNDIINATTDWVRAGFEVDDALGLAEVTTMYQHISDLDYDTAAENLITAYNGFKDELNGAFDGDKVAAVEYIADIFNELDRHNCP